VACSYCYGYLSKQAIWKYVCPLAPKKEDGTKIPRLNKKASDRLADGAVLLTGSVACSRTSLTSWLLKMH